MVSGSFFLLLYFLFLPCACLLLDDAPQSLTRIPIRLKKTPKQRHFSVQDDVVFFAPGAIYPIAPLFVDEPEASACAGVFENLENYSVTPKDGAVLGRVSHEAKEKGEVEFKVEAFLVKGTDDVESKDEL